jgi:hypothetical protein
VDADVIFYQFSRSKIERLDFSHFLRQFSWDQLPTGRRLRLMMNSLNFCIEGWDTDARELHTIPEVRRFYSAFHEAWPFWLYFCNLELDTLRTMVLCCLPSIASLAVDGSEQVSVTYEPLELVRFLAKDFPHMNKVCDRASMFEDRVFQRTKSIFEYFKLPFDAAHPGLNPSPPQRS